MSEFQPRNSRYRQGSVLLWASLDLVPAEVVRALMPGRLASDGMFHLYCEYEKILESLLAKQMSICQNALS